MNKLIYAYDIQNAVSGLLQLSFLLIDFNIIWHTCFAFLFQYLPWKKLKQNDLK